MVSKISRATLIISFIGMSIVGAQCQSSQDKPPHETQMKINKQITEGKVNSSFVCFPNNRYMGKEQISVVIEGKTYFGCCMGCIGKLETQPSHRFSTDPFTKNKVDKSEAYIVIKPNSKTGEVLYFESESNYNNFLKMNE